MYLKVIMYIQKMSYVRVKELHSYWEWSVLDACAVLAVVVAAGLKVKDCRSRRAWLD